MGRRSDHTREQLAELIVNEGHRQLAEAGFARFSAREVAKRIGYSIGTLYNVFGSYDGLMLALNGRTLDLWRRQLEARLGDCEGDRLAAAIGAYFDFALANRNVWTALYDFRLPVGTPMPDAYASKVEAITRVVVGEVRAALPETSRHLAAELTPSLLAIVHGHCFFAINGTFAVLGTPDPLQAARARVAEAVAAAERQAEGY